MKRYALKIECSGGDLEPGLYESDAGEWVRYADAQELEWENKRQLEAMKDAVRILRNDQGDPDDPGMSDMLNSQAEQFLRDAIGWRDGC